MLALALLALAAAGDSWAGGRGRGSHGGHHFSGAPRAGFAHRPHFYRAPVLIGAPVLFAAPYYYAPPPPYYYAPPPVYVEPYPAAPAPQSQDWFYCPNAGAYYPYVKECAGGWQRVLPQPQMQTPSVG